MTVVDSIRDRLFYDRHRSTSQIQPTLCVASRNYVGHESAGVAHGMTGNAVRHEHNLRFALPLAITSSIKLQELLTV